MDWHQKQTEQILRHVGDHRNHTRSGAHDLSCKICFPGEGEITDERFQSFWDWYQDITSVQEFSGKTKEIFGELMNKHQENIIEGRENPKINALIYSMRYQDNSGFSVTDIRSRIMTMVAISDKFTRDMNEATRSYKTESSKGSSPKKDRSPKGSSPKAEGSRINKEEIERELEELTGSEGPDIGTWDTSTEKIIDDDEMERIRLDLELRRLRRIERTRSLDKLESIKSEENPYSSLGSLSPMELVEIGAGTFLDEEILQEKLEEIGKKLGERTEETLKNFQEGLRETIEQEIKELQGKEILTEKDQETLKKFKLILKQEEGSVLKGMAVDNLLRTLQREDEWDKDHEKNDEDFFQERYNRKKEKYDKLKERMGDEIDRKLINAKERLHENITQRIKYYEEKETLTISEAQELEDLKRPGKMDEEELLVDEYVIHEIYQEQFDKDDDEKVEKHDTKKKGKEIEKPPIKLELEKEDEYTTGTVGDFEDYLNRKYGRTKDIDLEDFIREMGIESTIDEIDKERTKEKEDEEIRIEAEHIIDKEENIINTPEISLSSESESEQESENNPEEEIEFELYLGNQDLNLTSLFEEEPITMALSYGVKLRTFEGRVDESVEDWIEEFENIANFNNWTNADEARNPRLRAAVLILRKKLWNSIGKQQLMLCVGM